MYGNILYMGYPSVMYGNVSKQHVSGRHDVKSWITERRDERKDTINPQKSIYQYVLTLDNRDMDIAFFLTTQGIQSSKRVDKPTNFEQHCMFERISTWTQSQTQVPPQLSHRIASCLQSKTTTCWWKWPGRAIWSNKHRTRRTFLARNY